jgi:chromosome segregation ATPase
VCALQERNGFLQRSVEEYRRQLENQQELATVTKNEYEKRLKDEQDGGHSRMQVLQERMLQADRERIHATKEADDLRDLLTTAQHELTTLREQTQNIQMSLSELGTRVMDLTMQNHALQAENSMLIERNITISARYDTNNLVSHQGVFPETLIPRAAERRRKDVRESAIRGIAVFPREADYGQTKRATACRHLFSSISTFKRAQRTYSETIKLQSKKPGLRA